MHRFASPGLVKLFSIPQISVLIIAQTVFGEVDSVLLLESPEEAVKVEIEIDVAQIARY